MKKLRGSAGLWMAGVSGVLAALTLAACGGGGGGDSGGQGSLRFSMTDEPACYEHVWVTVERVGVHTSGTAGMDDAGWRDLTLATPQRIDLRTLTNGVLQELGTMPLPAGTYSQVRLVLAPNTSGQNPPANAVQVTSADPVIALQTPSGQQSGVKLQAHVTIDPGRLADLVMDFDACKSVVQAGQSGRYLLKPVVNVTPKFVAGIEGYVSTSTTLNGVVVSAQQNGGTVVRSTTPDASGKFVLAFLADGSYDIVVTAPDRATAVVTSVPVSSTGTATVTTVNGTSTAIVLAPSTMGTVSGTVSATTTSGGTTSTVVVTDATVAALQTSGVTTYQVASKQVNEAGFYSMSLPLAAPTVGPFTTGTLTLTPDASAAGRYTLQSSSPSVGTKSQTATLSATPATVNIQY